MIASAGIACSVVTAAPPATLPSDAPREEVDPMHAEVPAPAASCRSDD
jgi:hypothetical protein